MGEMEKSDTLYCARLLHHKQSDHRMYGLGRVIRINHTRERSASDEHGRGCGAWHTSSTYR